MEEENERYVVMINVVPKHKCEVLNNLKKAVDVTDIYSLYGEYDILVMTKSVKSIKHILQSRFVIDHRVLKISDGFIVDRAVDENGDKAR